MDGSEVSNNNKKEGGGEQVDVSSPLSRRVFFGGLQGQICHSDRQTYKRADYGLRITDGWTGGQDRGVNGVF